MKKNKASLPSWRWQSGNCWTQGGAGLQIREALYTCIWKHPMDMAQSKPGDDVCRPVSLGPLYEVPLTKGTTTFQQRTGGLDHHHDCGRGGGGQSTAPPPPSQQFPSPFGSTSHPPEALLRAAGLGAVFCGGRGTRCLCGTKCRMEACGVAGRPLRLQIPPAGRLLLLPESPDLELKGGGAQGPSAPWPSLGSAPRWGTSAGHSAAASGRGRRSVPRCQFRPRPGPTLMPT